MEQVFVKAHCSTYLTVLTPFLYVLQRSLNLQTTFLSPSLESVFLSLPLSTFVSLLILNIDCLKNKHNKRYTSTKREQCTSTPDFFFKGSLWPARDCSKTIRSLSPQICRNIQLQKRDI